jgi:hypothetical protein
MDAVDQLRQLQDRRAEATARTAELEHQARQAAQEAQARSAELTELERTDSTTAKRRQAEQALTTARARADEPWAERVAGARARVRDIDKELRAHVEANLLEVIAPHEADAAAAVTDMLSHAEGIVTAYRQREDAARRIGGLLALVTRVSPGDVGPLSRADQLVQEANRLLATGEPSPRLQRDPRFPFQEQAPVGDVVTA